MWGEPKQASSATTSIIYITIGALLDVWTTVYYFYCRTRSISDETYYWIYGAFFSGVVLMVIGAAVGRIGRSAMPAEVSSPPPQMVAPTAIAPTSVVDGVGGVGGSRTAYIIPAENVTGASTSEVVQHTP